MPVYNVKLTSKKKVANGTVEFILEKPEGFEFRAGQFCDITLINPPETDEEGSTRGFSFVSAPYENYLAVATRLRETAFKRVFRNLPDGSQLKLDAPYGDFTLHKNISKPAVFIIGGIGVTPVFSIIKQAVYDKTNHKITLIHSNKSLADAPFHNDLKQLSEKNPNFKFISVFTEDNEDDLAEYGRVNGDMIKKYVDDFKNSIFYLSGPQGMVKTMRHLLVEIEADEDNIRTEEFDGY